MAVNKVSAVFVGVTSLLVFSWIFSFAAEAISSGSNAKVLGGIALLIAAVFGAIMVAEHIYKVFKK